MNRCFGTVENHKQLTAFGTSIFGVIIAIAGAEQLAAVVVVANIMVMVRRTPK